MLPSHRENPLECLKDISVGVEVGNGKAHRTTISLTGRHWTFRVVVRVSFSVGKRKVRTGSRLEYSHRDNSLCGSSLVRKVMKLG
jgi:hypothetical protein